MDPSASPNELLSEAPAAVTADQTARDGDETAGQNSRLLDLPFEIRARIFSFVFEHVHIHAHVTHDVFPFHHLPPDVFDSASIRFNGQLSGLTASEAAHAMRDPATNRLMRQCLYCQPYNKCAIKFPTAFPDHPASYRLTPAWTACRQLYAEFADMPWKSAENVFSGTLSGTVPAIADRELRQIYWTHDMSPSSSENLMDYFPRLEIVHLVEKLDLRRIRHPEILPFGNPLRDVAVQRDLDALSANMQAVRNAWEEAGRRLEIVDE